MKKILIFILFLAATFIFFYPVLLKINSRIAGFSSTDEPFGVIWSFWWFKYSFLHKISPNFINVIAHPFGIIQKADTLFPFWGFLARIISIITNEVIAYNTILLSSFVLSALTMYYLVFFFTKDTAASIFSSLIYAFCPFHLVRVFQHFGTAQIQWMPLFILLLFKVRNDRRIKTILLLSLGLALNYYYDVHYAYFMLIVSFLFCVLVMFNKNEVNRFISVFYLGLGILGGLILIIPVFLPLLSKLSASVGHVASVRSFVRPFEDLFSQSARPLSYFLPFTEQPIFGNFTRLFVGSDIWGASLTEHNIFLGFIPISLSIFAFIKRRALIVFFKDKGKDISFVLKFFFCLVAVSWLFSQPPWWNLLGFKIYMPSFLMYKILPMFRAYVRFGVLVMLGVSVLAGFGLLILLARFRSLKVKISIAILVCVLSMFEFWCDPKEHSINLANYPQVYHWLKEQPGDFVVAEYPLDIEGPNETYKFYQTKHNKKIINGCLPGTYAHNVAQTLIKLSSFKTNENLSWMGVKYVLVRIDGYRDTGLTEDVDELVKIRQSRGLNFVRNFENIEVYEVVAPAVQPIIKENAE